MAPTGGPTGAGPPVSDGAANEKDTVESGRPVEVVSSEDSAESVGELVLYVEGDVSVVEGGGNSHGKRLVSVTRNMLFVFKPDSMVL